MFRLLLIVFQISPKTLGKQIVRPTMLKWNSRHMTSFVEETGDHLLLSVSSTNNFRLIWLVLKDPYGRRAHTHRSMFRHLWRSYKRISAIFLYTNRREPFFQELSNCAGSKDNKSFLRPVVHAVLNVCLVEEMYKNGSISRYVTWRSVIISSRTASMFSSTTTVFGGPSRNSSLSELRPRLNSLKQFFTVL